MRSLWIANLCNLVLDPLLIFGIGPFPELGVTGAAVATTTGRGIGVLYQVYRLAAPGKRFTIHRQNLRFEPATMLRLLRLSGTGILQILIIIFAILPCWGMANAAATMVGQALGAGKPERAEQSVWLAGR